MHNFEVFKAGEVFLKLLEDSKKQFKLNDENFIIVGHPNEFCMIDEYAIKITIDNLVDNAIKYSNNICKIKVELKIVNNKIHIIFNDNEIGIPEAEHNQIFKKNHRIYRKDIPNVKGTGLGLYWVKEIVKVHGGKISVKSACLNLGSSFLIEFPIYKESTKNKLQKLLNIKK